MTSPLHIVRNARDKYLDPRWQKKRLQIMQRDNFTCQVCGATDRTLHVHHIYYTKWAEGPWDYFDEALITLCNECHELEHENMPDATEYLMSGLVSLGINTTEKLNLFADFLEAICIGRVDEEFRQLAANYLTDYWLSGRAFCQDEVDHAQD